jgi:hypothetical protein
MLGTKAERGANFVHAGTNVFAQNVSRARVGRVESFFYCFVLEFNKDYRNTPYLVPANNLQINFYF